MVSISRSLTPEENGRLLAWFLMSYLPHWPGRRPRPGSMARKTFAEIALAILINA